MKKIISKVRKIFSSIIVSCTDRLVKKLILLFTAIIILVVGTLTFISYRIIENESIRSNINNNINNLKLVNRNIDDYFSDIDQLSSPQFKYERIISALLNESEDYSEQYYLEEYIRSLFYSRKDIEGIYIYLAMHKKYYYILRADTFPNVRIVNDESIPGEEWYKKAITSKEQRYIQSFLVPNNLGYTIDTTKCFMAYHRVLFTITNRKPIAILSFYYNALNRDEVLKGLPENEGEFVLLLDKQNVPFYIENKSYPTKFNFDRLQESGNASGQDDFVWWDGKEKYLVTYNISETGQWKLIKLIPYSHIYKAAQTNRNLGYLVGAVILVLSILVVLLVSNAITKPLKMLSMKMVKFSDGHFNVEAEVKGRDEIAQLSNQFNLMVKKTNDLINERYRMELVEKNAILKALEAEINPHFLYNALQAISTKALKSGEQSISKMVDALASTFRYSISGSNIVSIGEELKYVENYLVLQKARFGNRLHVLYDLDNSALDIRIPKLSVQSLVENSIKHALEEKSSGITMVIKAGLDGDKAMIRVTDNGPGISPDRLDDILESFNNDWEKQDHKCIGLKNLNSRLKLIYGDHAELTIRTDSTGTEVSISILQEVKSVV